MIDWDGNTITEPASHIAAPREFQHILQISITYPFSLIYICNLLFFSANLTLLERLLFSNYFYLNTYIYNYSKFDLIQMFFFLLFFFFSFQSNRIGPPPVGRIGYILADR